MLLTVLQLRREAVTRWRNCTYQIRFTISGYLGLRFRTNQFCLRMPPRVTYQCTDSQTERLAETLYSFACSPSSADAPATIRAAHGWRGIPIAVVTWTCVSKSTCTNEMLPLCLEVSLAMRAKRVDSVGSLVVLASFLVVVLFAAMNPMGAKVAAWAMDDAYLPAHPFPRW